MGKLSVKDSVEINAPADKAWEIIGPNFLNISDWGSGILKSWNNEKAPIAIEGAPAGGRFCDLGKYGIFEENLIHYAPAKREVAWTAKSDKLPGFIKNIQNALQVEAIDEENCRVSTNITAEATGIAGLLTGGIVRKNFARQLKGFLQDWKAYAETGEVSGAKKRQMG